MPGRSRKLLYWCCSRGMGLLAKLAGGIFRVSCKAPSSNACSICFWYGDFDPVTPFFTYTRYDWCLEEVCSPWMVQCSKSMSIHSFFYECTLLAHSLLWSSVNHIQLFSHIIIWLCHAAAIVCLSMICSNLALCCTTSTYFNCMHACLLFPELFECLYACMFAVPELFDCL